jgi:formylglycine-generating enzyme required for sulfatase activity
VSGDPRRVIRGGSWNDIPRYARVASRIRDTPDFRDRSLGLRLVEEVDEIEAEQGAGSPRVNRGGSWYNSPSYARVATRRRYTPDYRNCNLGLRLVEETGSYRVFRGGSWFNLPRGARVALRFRDAPDYRLDSLGLRLVEVTDG